MQTYQKKSSNQTQAQDTMSAHLTAQRSAIPNSAMLSMLHTASGENNGAYQDDQECGASVEEKMSALRESMFSRLSSTPIRPQAQIPRAEEEADRLSANIFAASPEGVKRDLGRRMDADFSSVRFHTGASAAAKANAMGARAFTSGADVYFGEGGFDPAVAAHELVHTAQQGMVTAGVETMSTPVGGVQMLSTHWSRQHHDAESAAYEAMTKRRPENGGKTDWEMLSEKEKLEWKAKNLLAYRSAKKAIKKKAKGKTEKADKIEGRIRKRQEELNAAQTFLNNRAPRQTSMLTKGENGEWQIGGNHTADEATEIETTSVQDKLDQVADTTDLTAGTSVGVTGQALGLANDTIGGAALGTSSDVFSGIGGGLNVVQGTYGMVNDSIALAEAIKEKDVVGAADAGVSLVGNTSSVASGITDLVSLTGAVSGTAGGVVGGITGMVSGGANIYSGAREIHEGRKKTNAMKEIKKDLGARENLEGNDLLLRDTAEQARQEGVRQKTEGSGKVITGALDAAAGAVQIGGVVAPVAAGATSIAGAALGGLSAATKVGFAIANHKQKEAMKESVVEQALGITEQDIKDFQTTSGIKNYHRAKQALMKAMGYTSGQRREAYADQTEKRGEYFAEKANAQNTDQDSRDKAQKLMKGLGVKADETGAYDAAAAAQSMGLRDSRAKILKKTDFLGTQVRKARSNQAQNAASAAP